MHGVTSFHEEATPTCGFPKSSSENPTARSIARAGARSGPSVTSQLRGRFRSPRPRAPTASSSERLGQNGTRTLAEDRACMPGEVSHTYQLLGSSPPVGGVLSTALTTPPERPHVRTSGYPRPVHSSARKNRGVGKRW